MTSDSDQTSGLSKEEVAERIAALEGLWKDRKAPSYSLLGVESDSAVEPGQIWDTRSTPVYPEGLPAQCRSDNPFLVIVLEKLDKRIEGQQIITVAAIDHHDDMAGPGDLVLSRSVLGFDSVLWVSASVGMIAENLSACRGKLPDDLFQSVSDGYRWTQSDEKERPVTQGDQLSWGRNYFYRGDVRWSFHEKLIEDLAYLQAPYLACLEMSGMLGSEATETSPEPSKSLLATLQECWTKVPKPELNVIFDTFAPVPAQASDSGKRWSRGLVIPGRLEEWLDQEDVGASDGSGQALQVSLDAGPERNSDLPGACYARWKLLEPPETVAGGNLFVVIDQPSGNVIGSGKVSRDRRFAILKEGDWDDFEGWEGDAASFVLVVEGISRDNE